MIEIKNYLGSNIVLIKNGLKILFCKILRVLCYLTNNNRNLF